MATIEDILGRKESTTQAVWILLRPALRDERAALLADLEEAEKYDAMHNEPDTAPAIQAAIDDCDSRIAENRELFEFQSIGREAYSKLLDENGPRADNSSDEDVAFNIDEFPPRLLALSCTNPVISLADATKMWNDWSDGETTKLLSAAVIANKGVVDVPFTNAGISMATLTTASRSNTAPVEESNTPIS